MWLEIIFAVGWVLSILLASLAFIIITVASALWIYTKLTTRKPHVYTKVGSALHARIEKHIPLLKKEFRPTWWCPHGTLQTVLRQFFREYPKLPFQQEIFELKDGGALGLDWLVPEISNDKTPIIVFLPGITGSTHDSNYLLHPAIVAREQGWKVVVVNPRGLGGVRLRTSRTYNAAWPDDTIAVLDHISTKYPEAKKIGCGFSMGGMILWNYLAKCDPNKTNLDAAMIISSPFDAFAASDSVERFIPRLIFNNFLARSLVAVVEPYREMFEHIVNFQSVLEATTVREFDTRFVAPVFGYKDIDEYYGDCTLRTKIDRIPIPTVCLNAEDDVFSPIKVIPLDKASEHEQVVCVVTAHGGHTAFMEGTPNDHGLVEKLMVEWASMFFNDLH